MNERPTPVVDSDSRPYWEAISRHKFMLPYCTDCERFFFFPRVLCPHCHETHIAWRKGSGRGKIYTFTISRRPAGPAFKERLPYVVALIDLTEGPRIMSNVVGTDIDAVHIGDRVQIEFEEGSENTLPVFRIMKD